MKFTVFGASGFIGSHLVKQLRTQGIECACPARYDADIYKTHLGNAVYCVGLTADYSQRPFDTVRAHVCHFADILENCDYESVVYLSSTRLYDSSANVTAIEELDLMLNPLKHRHLYDISKSMGESLCLSAGKGRCRIARLSCVYGDSLEQNGFLGEVMRRALSPTTPRINTSPFYKRDYIHVEDVVKLLIKIAQYGAHSIYNVANGENVSNQEIFDTINKVGGCQIQPSLGDEGVPPPVISIERIKTEFDYIPSSVLVNVANVIRRYLPSHDIEG